MSSERAFVSGVGLAAFASAFGMRIVDPTVPSLASEFHVTVALATLAATLFSVGYAVIQPLLGPYGDSVGKIRVINGCLVLLMGFHALCALAPTFESLLVFRVCAGIVGGGVIPVCLAVVGDRIAFERRHLVLSRVLLAIILGQMSGALTSGFLTDLISWRSGFFVASLVALVAAIMVRLSGVRDPEAPQAFRLSSLPDRYRTVFANPKAAFLYAVMVVEGAAIFGITPFVAAYLHERFAIGASEAGLVIGAISVGGLIYGAAVTLLLPRLGSRGMVVAGAVAAGLATMSLPFIQIWQGAIVVFLVIGFGFFMMHNTLQTFATEVAPTARGAAVSLFAGFFFVGHALGPILVGLGKTTLGWTPTLMLVGFCLLVLGPVARRLLSGATPAR